MAVMLKDGDGKVLLVGGKVARDSACCCCIRPDDAPASMLVNLTVTGTVATNEFCGEVDIRISCDDTTEAADLSGICSEDGFWGLAGGSYPEAAAYGLVDIVYECPADCGPQNEHDGEDFGFAIYYDESAEQWYGLPLALGCGGIVTFCGRDNDLGVCGGDLQIVIDAPTPGTHVYEVDDPNRADVTWTFTVTYT